VWLGRREKTAKFLLEFVAMEGETGTMDERRPVTILFTDIVGSTALAEKLDPEEWKEIVNGAHQRVSDAVTRYEGTVAQLLGDGVLAFFGAPLAHEDDPVRAVQAGLEIQREMAAYAQTLKGVADDFQMRVGINTGMVVVGAVGSSKHEEYLAVGDAVNLAARMQSAAEPGSVLLSENTARLVGHAFELRDLGEISVKGKSEPVRVHEVTEKRALFTSGRGIAGLTSPLVGREHELEQLREALQALEAGHGQIAVILGEAGIGKSRLVEEARRGMGAIAVRFLEGRALSYGQALPFWTITQLIQNDLGLADGDPEVRIKVALKRRVRELFGDRSEEVQPYLMQLLGLTVDGEAAERIKALDGETLKRQTLLALGGYFSRIAEQQSTVLVFEDLHWADPSTLETLTQLLAFTDRVPLMLLALMRAERDGGAWRFKQAARTDYEHRYTEINLKPLTHDQQNRLVDNLLEIQDLPERTRRLILERAEGNPFYLEEIIRNLIEQGALVHEGDHWRTATEIVSVEIPDTVQGVLLARIDRLDADLRRTLQLASVIGKTFLYRILQAIAAAEQELDTHLAQLQRADLVREKARRPELEYMFKHSLTQEAAYDSLVVERRREFHRKVGNALEELFAERRDEFLGLLAYHFDRAGEREKAIDYLIRAGDKTRLEDAHEEAVKFYERAIELAMERGDLDRAGNTWLKLGLIYHANFEFDKAHEANERAFQLLRQAQHTETRAAGPLERPDATPCVLDVTSNVEFRRLDPGLAGLTWELDVMGALFAGIAEMDAEMNVLPHAARSWQVLDAGRRYLIHLREDVRWSDGILVTASDFEWAWKRNLAPTAPAPFKSYLDAIVGALDFRLGRNSDPDSVAVRALDARTLEVRLVEPVAYFPYLLAQSVTFPLPRAVIERFGAEWWKPVHIVCNGAFRLKEFSGTRVALERNPYYFGAFPGNLDGMEWTFTADRATGLDDYVAGTTDLLRVFLGDISTYLADSVPTSEQHQFPVLAVHWMALAPGETPLNDVRVRRALLHALDRDRVAQVVYGFRHASMRAGIVPPGMPGHSPGLGLTFDLPQARRLLAEAGYPEGRGLPQLTIGHPYFEAQGPEEIARQWHEHLGVNVALERVLDRDLDREAPPIFMWGWTADYPDPDNFLRNTSYYDFLRQNGWHNERYDFLVAEAARTTDRAKRLAMYREADRIWVEQDAVMYPLDYTLSGDNMYLVKPWVKGYRVSRASLTVLKNVSIEPH
jgi:ABC-type oligopeptide transport system substrate-binding subunit/class 3 adenylate cyclase